jgi:hypothetical protein
VLRLPRFGVVVVPGYTCLLCALCATQTSQYHIIVGQSYIIDQDGAELGRGRSNTVALCLCRGEKVVCVDDTISLQHARIEFEAASGQFFISDGTPTAPSSNGTWFR